MLPLLENNAETTTAAPSAIWKYGENCTKLLEGEIKKYIEDTAAIKTNKGPRLMLATSCVVGKIFNPLNGAEITKNDMALYVVFIDMVVVVCFLIFIWIIEDSQESYANQFKDESIEMNDFAIRVKGMPHDNKYGSSDNTLRCYLMQHFESIIKD